jgi:ribosome-binding factor A
MKARKITRRAILSAAAEVGEQDGQDPRYDRPEGPRKVPNRKALQLCAQVAEALGGVLAGECRDEALRDLVVDSVVPAPSAARLLVTLAPALTEIALDVPGVLAALDRAHLLFRAVVAQAIHRRCVPELTFQVRVPSA